MAWYDTVYCMVWHSMVRNRIAISVAVWNHIVLHGMVPYRMAWYVNICHLTVPHTALFGTAWRSMVRYFALYSKCTLLCGMVWHGVPYVRYITANCTVSNITLCYCTVCTVSYSVLYDMVQSGMVWYRILHGILPYDMIWEGNVCCGAVPYMVRYITLFYGSL